MSLRKDLPHNVTLPGIPRGLIAAGDASYVQAAADRAGADRRGVNVVLDEIGELADATAKGFMQFREQAQASIDELNGKIAALQVGGADTSGSFEGPTLRQAKASLAKFARTGILPKAAMSTDSSPDGGYMVVPEMDDEIKSVLTIQGVMRRLANQVRIGTGGAYEVLVSMANGSSGGWVGERETRDETDNATLAKILIPAMEVYAEPHATQRMIDDSRFDVAAFILGEIARQFGLDEGAAFVSGNGVNKPRGFLQYDTVANASWSWGKVGFVVTGEAADLIAEDPGDQFINLVYSLPAQYRNPTECAFVMNSTLASKVRKFKDDADNYLWTNQFQGGIQAATPDSLLGFRVEIDDNMPDVGAGVFPVAFANWRRAYTIVDQGETTILRDPYTKKGYVKFYSTKRVGGGIVDFKAIKLLKCST